MRGPSGAGREFTQREYEHADSASLTNDPQERVRDLPPPRGVVDDLRHAATLSDARDVSAVARGLAFLAASAMTAATAFGCDNIGTCPDVSVVVVALISAAIARSYSGGSMRSSAMKKPGCSGSGR